MADCCDPGYKKVLSNGSSNPSCKVCDKGTYSNEPNCDTSCHECVKSCGPNEFVVEPCSNTTNLVCACKPGYFKRTIHDFQCEPYTLCPPGQGVSVQGTNASDTQCIECSHGTFSDLASSTQRCQERSSCADSGFVLDQGNATTDNTCFGAGALAVIIVVPIVVLILLIGALIYWWYKRNGGWCPRGQRSQNDLNVSSDKVYEKESFILERPNIQGSVKTLNTQPSMSDDDQAWTKADMVPPPSFNNSFLIDDEGTSTSNSISSSAHDFIYSLSLIIPSTHPLLAQLPGALTLLELSSLDTGNLPKDATFEHLRMWMEKNSNLHCVDVLKAAAENHGITV